MPMGSSISENRRVRFATGRMAALFLALVALSIPLARAQAQDESPRAAASQPKSLFELLDVVERGLDAERAENVRREKEFTRVKENQETLLAEAKASLARKEELSHEYEMLYNENEKRLGEAEALFSERLGQLGELFGVVRQVSNDLNGQVWDSLISAQLRGRTKLLSRLGRSDDLPSTDDLEQLWFELQREMTEQGQVVRFTTPVLTLGGQVEEQSIVRAGPFSALSRGKYLMWEPDQEKLRELTRQPPARYVETVGPFEALTSGYGVLALDPSKGSLLSALTDTPSNTERIKQGGYVGAVIITLGIMAGLVGLVRLAAVSMAGRKVAAQQKSDYADVKNPLGRVIAVYEENRAVDAETLELKLDEAVMRESASITRYMWLVKTVASVAPLLGLLGTVTGMIKTFQAITLFGAGDPKMMAGGISEALVTTMLGLCAAIPLVLLYDTLANSSRNIIDMLDEQSAGMIASRAERDSAGD